MTNNSKIKEKIAALLAKAEGTDNEFEQEAFMAKVNELLERHQIDLHEIRKPGVDADPMGKENGTTNLYVSMGWAKDVANVLARYYGCRFIYWKIGNHIKYEVVGRESARETFELMFPFVVSQVKQQGARLARQLWDTSASIMSREVGHALTIRIHKMVPQAEERRSELTKNALVPVSDVDAFVEANFALKAGKAKQLRYSSAAAAAADRVSINIQATSATRKQIK